MVRPFTWISDRIPELNETLETRQFCSFCRKSYLESESRVASGPGGTICESCLKLCEEVLAEQKGPPVLQYRTFCAFCGRRYSEVNGRMLGGPNGSICQDDAVELRREGDARIRQRRQRRLFLPKRRKIQGALRHSRVHR